MGTIWRVLFQIFLGGLKNLSFLNLAINKLSGSITDELLGLKKLKSLKMAMNRFKGCISKIFDTAENLEKLSLFNNMLEGNLPSSMATFDSNDEFMNLSLVRII